jgi:antitoxin component of RelBE/YafQ-DinJ toxin-antitoxin module
MQTKTVSAKIDADLKRRFDNYCWQRKTDKSKILRSLLEELTQTQTEVNENAEKES